MKIIFKYCIASVVLMCFLGGCNRVIDWGETNFNQGNDVETKAREARRYVKSVTVYDEFTTVGMFDALWLSDEVRTIYADLHALRRGKNEEYKKTFLRRQLEENNHFLTFYVLSPFEFPLADSQSKWSMFLEINGEKYFPIEVAVVELDQEYKAMFGKKVSRFKESFIVKFDAKTLDENPVITDDASNIRLQFRTLEKETQLVWNLGNENFQTVAQNKTETHTVIIEQETSKECA